VRIALICIGRLRREYDAVSRHYLSLLPPYATVEVVEAPETPVSRGQATVIRSEGSELLRRLRPHAYTVVLDRSGTEFSSEELSAHLADRKLYGASDFQFILGGTLGLDQPVLEAADLVWSLSRLTFPHQLARCVVLEQLYRALRIERGEPYHY
jgi:23S rRNA (pseudouridine1915-N3)-methyltransferase